MSFVRSQVAELSGKGDYYSAFSELMKSGRQTGSVHSMEADDLLLKLLSDPFFYTSVPEREREETLDRLAERNLSIAKGRTSIVGCAQFPVVSPDKQEVFLREFEMKPDSENQITERLTRDTRSELLAQLLALQSFIQENLSLEDGEGCDTTILNFGLKLEIRTPLFPGNIINTHISQNSIQFAAIVSFFSGFANIPVDAGFVFTGAFDAGFRAVQVGDTGLKIEKIVEKRPGVKKIFIPKSETYSKSEREIINKHSAVIEEISDLKELIERVFGNTIRNLLRFSAAKLHQSGLTRIVTTLLGRKKIGIQHYGHEDLPPFIEKEYETIYAKFSDGGINSANIRDIYTASNSSKKQMILLDGIIPLFWLGAYIHGSKNSARLVAVRYKVTDNFIIVASDEADKGLIGKQFKFKLEN